MKNDPLFWNKVAGAVLSAGLLAMVAGFVTHFIYHPETPEKQAYVIATGEPVKTAGAEKAAPAGPEPIVPLLAKASVEERSEERRGGKEWVSAGRSGGGPDH